jgi:hypothetical protein
LVSALAGRKFLDEAVGIYQTTAMIALTIASPGPAFFALTNQ